MRMLPGMIDELQKIAVQADQTACLPTTAMFGALDESAKAKRKTKRLKSNVPTEGTDMTNDVDGNQFPETGGEAAERQGQTKVAATTFPRDSLRVALAKVKVPAHTKSLRAFGKVAGVRNGNPIVNLRRSQKVRQLLRKYFRGSGK